MKTIKTVLKARAAKCRVPSGWAWPQNASWQGNQDMEQADEEIRTLDPLLGKEMLYH